MNAASVQRTYERRLAARVLGTELDTQFRRVVGRDENLRCHFSHAFIWIHELVTQRSLLLNQTLGWHAWVPGVLPALNH